MTTRGLNRWRHRRAVARGINDLLCRIEPPSRIDLLDWHRAPRGEVVCG